jgi:hypothetical protein
MFKIEWTRLRSRHLHHKSTAGVKWDRHILRAEFSYRDLSAAPRRKLTIANANVAPGMAIAA